MPDYDLHVLAGGLPFQLFTAPNIRLHPKVGGRSANQVETNVPIKKCGSKRAHYAPSRKLVKLTIDNGQLTIAELDFGGFNYSGQKPFQFAAILNQGSEFLIVEVTGGVK